MADDEEEIYTPVEPGDLAGLMDRYAHVQDWVNDFEAQYGSRPIYYGPLDRGARDVDPRNLIYDLKPPLFAHAYMPPTGEEVLEVHFGLA